LVSVPTFSISTLTTSPSCVVFGGLHMRSADVAGLPG
jgi:hypothetical protein